MTCDQLRAGGKASDVPFGKRMQDNDLLNWGGAESSGSVDSGDRRKGTESCWYVMVIDET